MNPPKFILNSQGVITHKIVPQGNGKFRVFPADANGNTISTDPNKSPTLDEQVLMEQISVMQKNGAKVIYDTPESNVEVPVTQMPLPTFGMPKVTDKMAPVDAELIKKYTEYNAPKPVANPIEIQRPVPLQNNPLFSQIDHSKVYDYEKNPEYQANNLNAPINKQVIPPVQSNPNVAQVPITSNQAIPIIQNPLGQEIVPNPNNPNFQNIFTPYKQAIPQTSNNNLQAPVDNPTLPPQEITRERQNAEMSKENSNVTTPTATKPIIEGDTNNDGVIDANDVVVVEPNTPELAENHRPFFTHRETKGQWENAGNNGALEMRTRPIYRPFTDNQRQDTSTATIVNNMLGKIAGNRDERRARSQSNYLDNNEENINSGNYQNKAKSTIKNKAKALFHNPMTGLARDVLNDKEGIVPDFDSVKEARQFHRAIKTVARQDEKERNRAERERNRIAEIRQRVADRLGRTISSDSPQVEPVTTVEDLGAKIKEGTLIPMKQDGGQIMQIGGSFPKPYNAKYRFDGRDELPEYRLKTDLNSSIMGKPSVQGSSESNFLKPMDLSKVNYQDNPFAGKNKIGVVSDPINLNSNSNVNTNTNTNIQNEDAGAPRWDGTKLNVFGNQMQHEGNMYPVMYNIGKSLFDKAEVQNPIYNKQDVAFLQGMKRNQIGANMNNINDNRAAMAQAIRGNARGSGQVLNALQASHNASSKNMNDELYRIKNANQAQQNNYLQALNQVGSNRREIDTLVDEKNRQHRLSFEKFQRDAIESGEKAQINKGQMLNQELSDKITMDNYLNQIGKNFKYKAQRDGTYLLEFEDFSGNKRTMDPRQTKATMEIMQKAEQDKQNTRQVELNAQAANDEKLKQNAATEEMRAKLKAYEDAEINAAREKKFQEEQAAKAKAEADAKAKGTNKTGGYIYKRKSF